jgi:hypothetical protein
VKYIRLRPRWIPKLRVWVLAFRHLRTRRQDGLRFRRQRMLRGAKAIVSFRRIWPLKKKEMIEGVCRKPRASFET